jgi:small subunit ribosomal protein S6
MKDAVEKFRKLLEDQKAEIVNVETWGLKKLAYPIQNKSTGFYTLVEFNAPGSVVNTLEIEFKRDERILRFLTVALDKDAQEYNEKRRKGAFNKKSAETKEKVKED